MIFFSLKDDVSTIGSSSTGSPHSHCKSLKNNGSRNQSPRSGLDRGEPRLRPGISGRNSNASSRLSGNMSTLQEDLMKLIDPDYNLDSSFIVSLANLSLYNYYININSKITINQ